jgi:hypothetical protein
MDTTPKWSVLMLRLRTGDSRHMAAFRWQDLALGAPRKRGSLFPGMTGSGRFSPYPENADGESLSLANGRLVVSYGPTCFPNIRFH